MRLAALLLAMLAAAWAPPAARAAAGLSLGWGDCRAGGSGTDIQRFGCASSFVELPLFPAFVLAATVDSVISMELVIDVDVAADSLPAWWRTDQGQCREGGWSADTEAPSTCVDAWNTFGVASFQGWIAGTPGSSIRHGRLLVAAAAVPGTLVKLDADVLYTACRVVLRTINTPTCAGCEIPACLVFNSLLIRRAPGSSVEEIPLFAPESPGLTFVHWQDGPGADCQSVPVRRSTWGAVKALYR